MKLHLFSPRYQIHKTLFTIGVIVHCICQKLLVKRMSKGLDPLLEVLKIFSKLVHENHLLENRQKIKSNMNNSMTDERQPSCIHNFHLGCCIAQTTIQILTIKVLFQLAHPTSYTPKALQTFSTLNHLVAVTWVSPQFGKT